MNVDELLAEMDNALLDMALGDIKRASQPGAPTGAKMAGFLLGFCFIDAVAGFHAGRSKDSGKIGKHFKSFVYAYMKSYDPPALYHDLRCGLVHSYAIGQTYAFTDNEKDGRHLALTATPRGQRQLLNLEDFLRDIEDAYRALCDDIRNDDERFAKAKKRYDSVGLLTVY